MGFLSKLFEKKSRSVTKKAIPNEYKELISLKSFMDSLSVCNHFVAKSEYRSNLIGYRKVVDYFTVLKSSGMLSTYCRENSFKETEIVDTISRYTDFEDIINSQNDQFVRSRMESEKEYLDNILVQCDPKINLDEDQRRVVLTDEDYCLVVAGAGAGKTTTIAAKVKYLVEKQNVDPKHILVISFTNKAVNELKQRIINELKIECPIATFHSTGHAILRKQTPEKLNIVDDSKLFYIIQNYLRDSVLKNEKTVSNLIMFFSSYFEAPYEGDDLTKFFNNIASSDYTSMRSEITDFERKVIDIRTKKEITIQNEVLRSHQEVEIANFLYLNNIDYEYEQIYPYNIQFARKPYTPDFIIRQGDKTAYIEHFGITEEGKNDRYSKDQLETYKNAINTKIRLHRQHGTTLIYTFSSYNDKRPITEHLKEKLEEKGFVLEPRSNKEVMEKLLTSEANRYIRKLVNLICRFISNFKTNGYTSDDFNRMYNSTQNVRSRLFLDICNSCYLEYQHFLKENDAVDFQDMINESARILREVKEMKQKLDFKYVVVDEYQDISRQRFDLVTALHEVTEAKIIAVGDDWQSIYAFSGSDITLFTKFEEKMGYAKLLKIVNTYRNAQEIIDIAGGFIQKNFAQIQKELISPKHIADPVIIYTYNSTQKDPKGDNRSGANYALAHATEIALQQIIAYNKAEGKGNNSSILVLGRYGFDGNQLERSGLFEYKKGTGKLKSVKYPRLNIDFMTVHSSKGLGYDNVIVVNGKNETYGFPSKIEDDPVLSFVVREDRSITYAEERRLFYVAMTRTKNRVFFIAPEQNPSEFLLEIKRDFRNVVLKGEWNEDPNDTISYRKTCPMCGYPVQFRYKNAYGLKLFICTNEPEVCGFMTNDFKAGKLSIIKCDLCRDGYLVVKLSQNNEYVLSCTNFKKDRTGCIGIMNINQYFKYMNIKDDAPAAPVVLPKGSDIKPKKANAEQAKASLENYDFKAAEIKKADIQEIKYNEADLNVIVLAVLQCLSDISENKFYDKTTLTDVLRGAETKKIKDAALDKVKGYGRLSYLDRDDVTAIIDWLIAHNFIRQTKEVHPVLHPTYNGQHYDEVMTLTGLKKLRKYLENGENNDRA